MGADFAAFLIATALAAGPFKAFRVLILEIADGSVTIFVMICPDI